MKGEKHQKVVKNLYNAVPPKCNKVYVKDSKLHGKGVFAKEGIKKGETITYYPPHFIIFFPKGHVAVDNEVVVLPNNNIVKSVFTKELLFTYNHYISNHYQICGDPEIIDNMSFVGHIINDCVRGHSPQDNYNMEKYMELALKLCNSYSQFDNKNYLIPIIATKNIERDEEILLPYSYEYWENYDSQIQAPA